MKNQACTETAAWGKTWSTRISQTSVAALTLQSPPDYWKNAGSELALGRCQDGKMDHWYWHAFFFLTESNWPSISSLVLYPGSPNDVCSSPDGNSPRTWYILFCTKPLASCYRNARMAGSCEVWYLMFEIESRRLHGFHAKATKYSRNRNNDFQFLNHTNTKGGVRK